MNELLLQRMMNAVLAQMSVISEQRASSLEGRITGSKEPPMPHLDEQPMVDYFDRRFRGATSYASRRQVVLDAVAALKLARKQLAQGPSEPVRDSFEWKCAIADDPRPTKELQRLYSISRATVFRYRAEYAGLAGKIWTTDEKDD